MPNPYHDETGRFCSKEEMGEAIDRVYDLMLTSKQPSVQNEASGRWFELKREYEAINRGVVEVPEEWVGRVVNSGVSALPETAQGIDIYYTSGFAEEIKSASFNEAGYRAKQLLANPNTPSWIKDDIYKNAAIDLKAGIIQSITHTKEYPEIDGGQLLSFMQGENGRDWMVIQSLLGSDRLSYETKYSLAKSTGNLGTLIGRAQNEKELYAKNPDLERELLAEGRNPALSDSQRQRAMWEVATSTKDPARLGLMLASAKTNDYIVSLIASNEHLNDLDTAVLFNRVAEDDPENLENIYTNVRLKKQDRIFSAEGIRTEYRARIESGSKSYRGVGLQRAAAAKEAVERYGEQLDRAYVPGHFNRERPEFMRTVLTEEQTLEYLRQSAVLDSEPGRYEDLQKETKKLNKEARRLPNSFGADRSAWLYSNERRLKAATAFREGQILLAQLAEERAAARSAKA